MSGSESRVDLDKDCGPTSTRALRWNYAGGEYEPPIQQALSKHLKAGSVFYDVGAHIGIVSLFAARLVGSKGAVFAFEADVQRHEPPSLVKIDAADDVTRWLQEKAYTFEWLEDPTQLPCHLLARPENGSSFPLNNLVKDSRESGFLRINLQPQTQ